MGAVILAVDDVKVTEQRPTERRPEELAKHAAGPTPPDEVAAGRGAEGPDVAVHPILAPAGLITADGRALPHLFQYRGRRRRAARRCSLAHQRNLADTHPDAVERVEHL